MLKLGLIGKNIEYSFSRGYFADKFNKLDIKASYVNFDCDTLEDVQRILNDPSILGYNVTIPYKQEVISLLDHLDEHVERIGAVNTIKRNQDNSLTGYNTDFVGFAQSLLEFLGSENEVRNFQLPKDKWVAGKKALILGTGGASKAVAYALEGMAAHVYYVSRKQKLEENILAYIDLAKKTLDPYDIIVNTTPLGTYPNIHEAPEIPYRTLDSKHLLYDLVYNPEETRFLLKGKENGAHVTNGLKMLELQADAAWDLWHSKI